DQERKNRQTRFSGHVLKISSAFDPASNDGDATLFVGMQQLIGGTYNEATKIGVDSNGDQYQFAPETPGSDIGTLTITGGLIASGESIVIDGFDMDQAQTRPHGFLGIQFTEKVALEPSAAGGNGNPFNAGNDQPANATVTAPGEVQ